MVEHNDDFDLLNNFAHDLKTPLAAAKSYVELIQHVGELNDQQKHFSNRAELALERMERVIHVLLDYARMENSLTLHLASCDLAELVTGILDLLESAIQEHGLTITVDIPSPAHHIQADPRLLEHVMSNLIANAIKYNRKGGAVYITAQLEQSAIRVDVQDTGIGIPGDAQKRVWDRFYRADHKRGNSIEGTGLGLSIVKTIIERHGGSVYLHSIEGEGTTFSFTLPYTPQRSSDYDREPSDDIDDDRQEFRESLDQGDSDDRNI